MKLHQLHALVRVAEFGSIRAAARELHLTQAALTKALRQLEEEAGLALLERRSRGVVLTPAGQRFYARAALIDRQLQLARDDWAQSLQASQGSIRLALSPYLMRTVLAQAFIWFRKKYPQVQISVMEGLTARVLPALRDGTLDFAIAADSGDIPSKEFTVKPILRQTQDLVVRQGHPVLAHRGEADFAERLMQLEWVFPGPMLTRLTAPQQAMFDATGLPLPTRITRCDAMAAIALVRHGDCACLIPTPLMAQPEAQDLVRVQAPPLQAPSIGMVLISAPEVPLTPAAEYFSRCLMDEMKRP